MSFSSCARQTADVVWLLMTALGPLMRDALDDVRVKRAFTRKCAS